MMHVAFTELFTAYKAAFTGVGLTRGEAADAARMVLWLDRHGADAARHLPDVLEGLTNAPTRAPRVSFDDDSLTIDCRNASILAAGPAAVDVAIAESKASKLAKARLVNAGNVEFAGGLAAIIMAREAQATLSWHMPAVNNAPLLAIRGKKVSGTLPQILPAASNAAAGDITIDFRDQSPKVIAAAPLPEKDGLLLDEAVWKRIQAVADTVLVPESDKSRVLGAGIGADED